MIINRPRRNRKSAAIRAMVTETHLNVGQLIFPLFLIPGKDRKVPVHSMPGISRWSPDLLVQEIKDCRQLGINNFVIFPAIEEGKKDKIASEGYNPDGLYCSTLKMIKDKVPDICLITDVAMDPYSSDGHDGLVENGEIVNDKTLEILGKMALEQAKSGADILGPSDMMDGRVGHIRRVLDENGFENVSIMSYTAKYASAFYGPFRDALDSAPKSGDKKTYQMDPANIREALREARLDQLEGADILMVKPAIPYLDVIKLLYENFELPIAAYHVSGEYAMIKAAAANGWIDGEKAMIESLIAIRRAGASAILTYFAKEFALLSQD